MNNYYYKQVCSWRVESVRETSNGKTNEHLFASHRLAIIKETKSLKHFLGKKVSELVLKFVDFPPNSTLNM